MLLKVIAVEKVMSATNGFIIMDSNFKIPFVMAVWFDNSVF